MIKRLLLACAFSMLCVGGAYGQEDQQLKFSNAGVQTTGSGDYVAVLRQGNSYTIVAETYLQGSMSTPVSAAATVTATVRSDSAETMVFDGSVQGRTSSFVAPADSGASIIINAEVTTAGQTYTASVEIYYPISVQRVDGDNDGVPDIVSTEDLATRVTAKSSGNVVTYIEVSGDDSLVVLGNRARQSENYQAALTTTDLETLGEPPGYEGQGAYDFAFFHSTTVYTYVTVPLATTSAESKSWYVYDDGSWGSFTAQDIADANGGIAGVNENQYYSAEGTLSGDTVTCPDPDPSDAQWTSTGVVAAGHQCVLLAVFDGGANDGDGTVNGFVSQLGALGSVSSSGGGSSGASDLWLLMLLSAMLALMPFVRRCVTRAS